MANLEDRPRRCILQPKQAVSSRKFPVLVKVKHDLWSINIEKDDVSHDESTRSQHVTLDDTLLHASMFSEGLPY